MLAPAAAQATVLGDGLAAVQDRDGGHPEPHVQGPADEAERHRVAHAVALHVVVRRHLAAAPLAPLEGIRRQRAERRAPLAEERVVAAPPATGEGPGAQRADEPARLRVGLLQAREPLAGHWGERPRLARVDGLLGRRLVARPPGARRHHRAPVALGRLQVGAVDLRRLGLAAPVGRGGAAVGHDDVGRASGRPEGAHMGGDPGSAAHVREALGVHPSRPGEARDEEVGGRRLPRHRVVHGGGHPGPVDEHQPAGLAGDACGEAVGPGAVADPLAEPGVPVGPLPAGVAVAVAPPLQRERHLRDPRELAADPRAVGLEVLLGPLRPAVLEQRRHLGVGHRLEPLGADAPLARLRRALRDRRLAAAREAGRVVPARPLEQPPDDFLLRGHTAPFRAGGRPGGALAAQKGIWGRGGTVRAECRYSMTGTTVLIRRSTQLSRFKQWRSSAPRRQRPLCRRAAPP